MPSNEELRCSASKRDGSPCRQWPVKGTSVCKMHGGLSPQVQAAAKGRMLEAKLRGEVAAMQESVEPVTDPVAWIQDMAGEVAAFLALAREQLNRVSGWETDNVITHGTEVRAVVQVYERALDRGIATAAKMIQLGFQAQVTAAQVLQAKTIADGLRWMGVEARRRPDVPVDELVLEAIGRSGKP